MAINLNDMSRKELRQLRDDVEKAIRDAESRERRAALKAAEQAAAEYGFPLEELMGDKKSSTPRQKSAPKFRNPKNTEQTWTGRGRKPQWVHDALEKGADMKDLEI